MKIKSIKRTVKDLKKEIARIALGEYPGATYGDLFEAIWKAECFFRKAVDSKDKKIVLLAHDGLQEMKEIRSLLRRAN